MLTKFILITYWLIRKISINVKEELDYCCSLSEVETTSNYYYF